MDHSLLKSRMRGWILKRLRKRWPGERKVLCIGDGLGYDCARLALAGHDVTYHEVSDLNEAYARRLFAHYGATSDDRARRSAAWRNPADSTPSCASMCWSTCRIRRPRRANWPRIFDPAGGCSCTRRTT